MEKDKITEAEEFNKKMDAAEAEAKRIEEEGSSTAYTYKFRKPFEFEGKTYEELHFKFEELTGRDSLAIFNELRAKGKNVFPNISWSDADYVTLFASKCCEERLGSDAFLAMPASAYNRILARTSSFLMRAAL